VTSTAVTNNIYTRNTDNYNIDVLKELNNTSTKSGDECTIL